MVGLNQIVLRRFNDIAKTRYDEILKSYEDFFLTEEELIIPEINSILFVLDRYSDDVPEGVFKLLSAYSDTDIAVEYVIDRNVLRMIEETLGEEEAKKFREKELETAERILKTVESALKEAGLSWQRKISFKDKAEHVEKLAREYDMVLISRRYGSEATKTHSVSPIVFRVVQHVEKPIVTY